jgi:mono/diheme cytochrome c family protein
LIAGNAITQVLKDPLNFRSAFVILDVIAIAVILGVIIWRVFRSPKPSAEAGTDVVLADGTTQALAVPEEKQPPNLVPFYPDEEMEGRKLERVLGLALLVAALLAIALPIYYLRENTREAEAKVGFDERSIERGAALFANSQMPAYDATKSLQCANCHGTKGEGSSTKYVIKATKEKCSADQLATDPECSPQTVVWQAPALNTALLKYPIRKTGCSRDDLASDPDCRSQVFDIITYGRPGTPMPPWGVAGGGSKNTQSIQDLVNYLQSIQLSPAEAKKISTSFVSTDPAVQKATPLNVFSVARNYLDTAQRNLVAARAAVPDAQAALDRAVKELATATNADARKLAVNNQQDAEETLVKAQAAVPIAETAVKNSQDYLDTVSSASEGALLFQTNCARCHTKGWSYFDPSAGNIPLPSAQGSGALGPNLRGGTAVNQFPVEQDQIDFVTGGSQYEKPYGVRGIGNGRMPGFINILSTDQIKAIVDYERTGLGQGSPPVQ